MRRNTIWVMLALLCGAFFSLPCAAQEAAPSLTETLQEAFQKKAPMLFSPGEEKDYVVGPEDTLRITVWDHDDLTREVTISREGWFSYPLVGRVQASDLSVVGLERKVAEELSGKYVINPQVTVKVLDYKSKIVYVFGEVGGKGGAGKGPGAYPLTGKTTLTEILSAAGGPTGEAGSEILIVRPRNHKGNPKPVEEAGKDEIITVSLRKLLEGDTSQNIVLQHGDSINVPRADCFFVYGEVKNPGRYHLEKGTNVLKAIATAGGFTDKASRSRVKIIREKDGKRDEISVRMEDPVRAEDVIRVPMSFF